MIYPTVHHNGTHPNDLLAQITEAATELTKALGALQNAAPNGRDYCPQGNGAITTAIGEHNARVAAVTKVIKELEDIGMHIIRATE